MIIELGIAKESLKCIKNHTGAYAEDLPDVPNRLVTHSKEVRKNDLFCALRGNTDGHLYAKEAAQNGAIAILAEERTDAPIPHLLVKDVPQSLGRWAHAVLSEHPCRRVAITGSVGKTTVKNAIAAMLGTRFRIHKTEGNYNNLLGVSFTVLSMPSDNEILVVELGTNQIGEISYLSKIVEPNDAVITRIGHAHIAAFGTLYGTAQEKLSITDGMHQGGRLYIPSNEPLLNQTPTKCTRIEVSITCEEHAGNLPECYALSFARAIGKTYFLSNEEIKTGECFIQGQQTHRQTKWACSVCLIEDAYNASPESMLAAFSYLSSHSRGRKILVLGDMLELGEQTAFCHRSVGEAASRHADLIFVYGNYRQYYKEGACKNKAVKTVVLSSFAPSTLAKEILPFLRKGDTVLFKASHSLKADRIFQEIYSALSNTDITE